MTVEEARARIDLLADKLDRTNWGAACEIREYYALGLIGVKEYESLLQKFCGVDPVAFQAAAPEQRFEMLLDSQDSMIVLAAREAAQWSPPEDAAAASSDEE